MASVIVNGIVPNNIHGLVPPRYWLGGSYDDFVGNHYTISKTDCQVMTAIGTVPSFPSQYGNIALGATWGNNIFDIEYDFTTNLVVAYPKVASHSPNIIDNFPYWVRRAFPTDNLWVRLYEREGYTFTEVNLTDYKNVEGTKYNNVNITKDEHYPEVSFTLQGFLYNGTPVNFGSIVVEPVPCQLPTYSDYQIYMNRINTSFGQRAQDFTGSWKVNYYRHYPTPNATLTDNYYASPDAIAFQQPFISVCRNQANGKSYYITNFQAIGNFGNPSIYPEIGLDGTYLYLDIACKYIDRESASFIYSPTIEYDYNIKEVTGSGTLSYLFYGGNVIKDMSYSLNYSGWYGYDFLRRKDNVFEIKFQYDNGIPGLIRTYAMDIQGYGIWEEDKGFYDSLFNLGINREFFCASSFIYHNNRQVMLALFNGIDETWYCITGVHKDDDSWEWEETPRVIVAPSATHPIDIGKLTKRNDGQIQFCYLDNNFEPQMKSCAGYGSEGVIWY